MALYDVMLYSRLLIHFDFIFTHRFSSSFHYEVNSKLLLKRTEGGRKGVGAEDRSDRSSVGGRRSPKQTSITTPYHCVGLHSSEFV